MLDRISKVKIRNPRTYDKLQRIAASFPTSSDMNSAWIVKYSGKNKMDEDWDSYSIALRFLSSSIGNTDHILAYAIENNHDDISNYMAMHNACNSQKGSKHFLQWWNEDKENRTKYMQEYFDKADELIKTKKIKKKKYKHYVELAEQTIFDVSQGQLKLFKDEETFTEPKDQEEAQACQESEDFEEYEEAEDYEEDEEQPTDN
jgi:Cys-tRNA synthase (O-phospho-L-seryl-tRNA:Cys-tRNA synthase)